MLRKSIGSLNEECFTEYVLCPACYTIYNQKECMTTDVSGEQIPKTCCFVKYPKHTMARYRRKCGSPLMKKVHLAGGKIKYRPLQVYAYQPLKSSLQKLLNRPGYAAKMEHWRDRPACENKLSDIYDGKIWKEFNSDKCDNFLKKRRNYGVMLNFDFFQPYKHTTESYGVFYLTIINMP